MVGIFSKCELNKHLRWSKLQRKSSQFFMFAFVLALTFLAVAFGQTYLTLALSSGAVCGGSPVYTVSLMNVCYANSNVANTWEKNTYSIGTGTTTVTTSEYSDSACTTLTSSSVNTYFTVCTATGSLSFIASYSTVLTTSMTGYLYSV